MVAVYCSLLPWILSTLLKKKKHVCVAVNTEQEQEDVDVLRGASSLSEVEEGGTKLPL